MVANTRGDQHEREEDGGPGQRLARDELHRQQHDDARERVEQGRAQRNPREDLEREDDLLHVARVGEDQPRRPVQALREQAMHDDADEKDDREVGARLGLPRPQRALKITEKTKV
jgi:hypothetical protein